jgi:transmembrane sensor
MKRGVSSERNRSVDDEAAGWVVRQERGLTASEQDDLAQWLAISPTHGAAFAAQRWSWEELDRLNGLQASFVAVPDPSLLADKPTLRVRRRGVTMLALGFAALVAVGIALRVPAPRTWAEARDDIAGGIPLCERRTLEDGSTVDLNRGAAVAVNYSASKRHVRLEQGEAFFTVEHDSARPFIVESAGISIRAVGTAFSVKRSLTAVTILVTEGSVRLNARSSDSAITAPVVPAGNLGVVFLAADAPPPLVFPVTPREVEEHLAWKPEMLDFNEAPLAEIAQEFNRRNAVQLEIADAALQARRLSAVLRSDNIAGFVSMLEAEFGIRARIRADGVIALQPSP